MKNFRWSRTIKIPEYVVGFRGFFCEKQLWARIQVNIWYRLLYGYYWLYDFLVSCSYTFNFKIRNFKTFSLDNFLYFSCLVYVWITFPVTLLFTLFTLFTGSPYCLWYMFSYGCKDSVCREKVFREDTDEQGEARIMWIFRSAWQRMNGKSIVLEDHMTRVSCELPKFLCSNQEEDTQKLATWVNESCLSWNWKYKIISCLCS